MIRQAHTYLVGAVGGAALIAIAVAFFVVLVSAQVFKDWPIAALGGSGDDKAAVSSAHPAAGSARTARTGFHARVAAIGNTAKPAGNRAENGGSAAESGGVATAVGQDATGAGEGEGGGGGTGGSGGGSEKTPASQPSPSAPGSTGSSGSGAGSGSSGGSAGTTASTPSSKVTETVNGTVSEADEKALGGALDNSGVTEATEGIVNGVAGPESVVGQVVDETVGAVGGLLHGNH
jgi:hypothetical protein